MPFARLTLTSVPDDETIDRLSSSLTSLVAKDLGKRRELTSVLIEPVSLGHWSIGAEQRRHAAHLEVCVTAGTNSTQEKQTFISNAMALLRASIPELHQATYIVIRELSSEDWGFDGRTQADRAKAQSAISG